MSRDLIRPQLAPKQTRHSKSARHVLHDVGRRDEGDRMIVASRRPQRNGVIAQARPFRSARRGVGIGSCSPLRTRPLVPTPPRSVEPPLLQESPRWRIRDWLRRHLRSQSHDPGGQVVRRCEHTLHPRQPLAPHEQVSDVVLPRGRTGPLRSQRQRWLPPSGVDVQPRPQTKPAS